MKYIFLSLVLVVSIAGNSCAGGGAQIDIDSLFPETLIVNASGQKISYCPDNTCEEFSSEKLISSQEFKDFVFIYLYFVSDYYYLKKIREKVSYDEAAEFLASNYKIDDVLSIKQNALNYLDAFIDANYIHGVFVRYDEKERNTSPLDLKSAINKQRVQK